MIGSVIEMRSDMASSGRSRRDENKTIRAEDLRERIRNSGCLTKVLDNIDKMQSLANLWDGDDHEVPIPTRINNLQMVNNQLHKLLDKVLPTQKEVTLEGDLKLVAIDMTGISDDDND